MQFLHGFREGVDRGANEGVWGEEVQAEGEIGRREDGECFNEDIGDGLVAREVGVELIPTIRGEEGKNRFVSKVKVELW